MKVKNKFQLLFLLIPTLLNGVNVTEFEAGFDLHSLRKMIWPRPKLKEYERFFSPLLFIPYRDQLRGCVNDALLQNPQLVENPQVRNFLALTDEIVPAHPKSHREWHHRWLKQLRAIMASSRTDVEQLVDRICLWMYCEPDFFDVFASVLDLEFHLEADSEHALLPDLLEKSWKKIAKKDSVSGYKKAKVDDEDNHFWDPHLGGMLPTRLFAVGPTHLIYTPRIAHVHDDQIAITPEFLRYLKALKADNKSHLYINLMNRNDKREKAFSRKIENLENRESAFHAITLDFNSPFYKQRHTNLSDAAAFKLAFFQHLFESCEESSFYWTKALTLPKWKKECRQILNAVHTRYFQDKGSLNTSERRAFIDLTYITIIRTLCKQHGFDHANISCKHSMDRAPQLIALLFADDAILSGNWSKNKAQKFLSIVLAPPLLSHNRAALQRHIERISDTLPIISDCLKNKKGQ